MKPLFRWNLALALLAVLLAAEGAFAQSPAAASPAANSSQSAGPAASEAQSSAPSAPVAAAASDTTLQRHIAPMALKAAATVAAPGDAAPAVGGGQPPSSAEEMHRLHLIVGR